MKQIVFYKKCHNTFVCKNSYNSTKCGQAIHKNKIHTITVKDD